ncbi:hypothetical protein [Streptomyces bacillaris]|uniref:hypothetical protein n=1 Tax=Streptomyces bacillaris TaxID=68179 RepID=UPI003EB9A945
MNGDDEKGFATTETLGGTQIASTPAGYDPEDVQLSARTDDGDVVMYLPEITYLDTQQWSVEIGLTPDRLVQLRDALDNHLRGAADHAGPASRGEDATVAQTLARVRAAVNTPSGPPDEPTSEYSIGWDTAMGLVRAAIEEQP